MPYELSDLEVEEVSIVDLPANKQKFVVVKRKDKTEKEGGLPQEMLNLIDEILLEEIDEKMQEVLLNVRATVLNELGETAERGKPYESLEDALDAVDELPEDVPEDISRQLDELAGMLEDYIGSREAEGGYPAPFGYPAYGYPAYGYPAGKEVENMSDEKARKAYPLGYGYPFYGYPFYGYPAYPRRLRRHAYYGPPVSYAPYPYSYFYPYPYPQSYGVAKDEDGDVEKIGRPISQSRWEALQDALMRLQEIATTLSKILEETKPGGPQAQAPAEPVESEVEASKAESAKPEKPVEKAEVKAGEEKPDEVEKKEDSNLEALYAEAKKALEELQGLRSRVLTPDSLEKMVEKFVKEAIE